MIVCSTVRIISDFFTCGIVVSNKVVIEAAPIVKYMVGWETERVRNYCDKRGWKYDKITDSY
jgi:hypothetical protein